MEDSIIYQDLPEDTKENENVVKHYSFSYYFEGIEFSLTIPAYSLEEAQGRLNSIKQGKVEYQGVIVSKTNEVNIPTHKVH